MTSTALFGPLNGPASDVRAAGCMICLSISWFYLSISMLNFFVF